jgi:hypothetical protein
VNNNTFFLVNNFVGFSMIKNRLDGRTAVARNIKSVLDSIESGEKIDIAKVDALSKIGIRIGDEFIRLNKRFNKDVVENLYQTAQDELSEYISALRFMRLFNEQVPELGLLAGMEEDRKAMYQLGLVLANRKASGLEWKFLAEVWDKASTDLSGTWNEVMGKPRKFITWDVNVRRYGESGEYSAPQFAQYMFNLSITGKMPDGRELLPIHRAQKFQKGVLCAIQYLGTDIPEIKSGEYTADSFYSKFYHEMVIAVEERYMAAAFGRTSTAIMELVNAKDAAQADKVVVPISQQSPVSGVHEMQDSAAD